MDSSITRRSVLIASAGAGLMALPEGATAAAASATPNPAGLTLLVSTDGVNVPPRADGVQKFSYSWPEPSVDFAGMQFAFEVITFENRYAVDPATVTVTRTPTSLRFVATGLTWAGGQERSAGRIEADLRRAPDGAVEWTVSAEAPAEIKSVKTIVRGLPRGSLSVSASDWKDVGEDERIFEYPALFGGMATPLIAIKSADGGVRTISSMQREVRPARFLFWPGPKGYKVELAADAPAWKRARSFTAQPWRIASGPDFATAVKPHFDALGRSFGLPSFSERRDAPDWMKHLSLVLSLHGQHWSGHILNSYDRQREILRWAAQRIDPRTVMVFLAGWDGRYYWDYPAFAPDPRMGGEAGFRKLIDEGHRLGFKFLLMFGSNSANPASPLFPQIADARLTDQYGEPFPGNYVDWDGDLKGDGCMVFMNLAVDSWRRHLTARISDMVGRYGVDAYFLDICGLWENNTQGDMLLGLQRMVKDLAAAHPGVPPVAEMQYDAQMGFIPMSHVPRFPLYPQGNYDHVASFDHLSHPAPGRGSTGVHEYGFGTYKPVEPGQRQIPTITFSDDTLSRNADLVERDIATAKARFSARGMRT